MPSSLATKSTETTEDTSDSADELYTPVTVEDVEFQSPRKKKKVMEDKNSNAWSSMPEEYQHVRCSMRKVRPEYYEVVDKLKSCFHMSQNQAEAAVVETANKMFGRNWKYHDEEAEIDVDTLTDKKNARRVGKCIEAMALSEIVTEIVSSDDQSTITYANDGSKKQGAGSFTVQGIIINGKYRALPTMSIASESKPNLAELKLTPLQILSAASGVDAKVLFERIDFVISDQTAHNIDVELSGTAIGCSAFTECRILSRANKSLFRLVIVLVH